MRDPIRTEHRQQQLVRLFEQIMDSALEPLADPTAEPDSFFEGSRLLGVDSADWSAGDVPPMVDQLPMTARRRLAAALAKFQLASVVELSTHAPVAAVAAPLKESEHVLAGKLWARIPEHSLIIGDQFFGTPLTLLQASQATRDRAVCFLASVRDNIKSHVLQHLPDGSAHVEVPVRKSGRVIEHLRVREIRAVGTLNRSRFTVRLWTTLSNSHRYPAETLARHHSERWKWDLASRCLRLDARTSPLRVSPTMETALQEVAALLLASAVLARLRAEAFQRREVLPSWMSFLQVMRATKTLWDTFEIMDDTLTASQRRHALGYCLETVRQAVGRSDRGISTPAAAPAQHARSRGRVRGPGRPETEHVQIEVVRI